MDESLFVRSVVRENIKIHPEKLSTNVLEAVSQRVRKKFEGTCSRHGYIRTGSIEVIKYSLGHVQTDMLNGDVTFVTQFSADIANPAVGAVVSAVVKNINRFGIAAETGIRLPEGSYVPILDILIPKQTINFASEIDLESVHINDTISIEILARKFNIGDAKITVVGRVITKASDVPLMVDDGDNDPNAVSFNDGDSLPSDSDPDDGDEQEADDEDDAVLSESALVSDDSAEESNEEDDEDATFSAVEDEINDDDQDFGDDETNDE